MTDTPNLRLPFIQAAQAQKHVTHNEALRVLDAVLQISVIDRDLATPPISPANGDRYIIAPGGTGEWTGKDGQLAAFQDGAWMYYLPQEGWICWVEDDDFLLAYDGSTWIATGSGGSSVNPTPLVGVNATADTTNRLSVSSPATLFNHEGAGHQAKINKNTTGDTAAFLFQTNFSARAEIGLTGDDDFHFKVSPDGSTFHDNLIIDKSNGRVRIKGSNPIARLEFAATVTTITGGSVVQFDSAVTNVGHSAGYGPITSGVDQGKYKCEFPGIYMVISSVQPTGASANFRPDIMHNSTLIYRARMGLSAGYAAA